MRHVSSKNENKCFDEILIKNELQHNLELATLMQLVSWISSVLSWVLCLN
jgi:hypothetical protein